MEVDDSERHRSVLEREINVHASRPVDLLIVDDIAQWSASRIGNARGNPPAMAVTDDVSGRWAIVLRRAIDENWVGSIISRIEFSGFLNARATLASPELFLRHTVLHELAHLENAWGQDREDDCDEWAFDRLDLAA